MIQGLRRLTVALTLTAGVAGAASAPAEPLTIQGSSTFASGILIPNQSAIEKRSGQSLKIVGVRSDIGLLRLLARQSEFAIISTPLRAAIESVRNGDASLPYKDLIAFPVSRVRVAFAVNPKNPIRKASLAALKQVLSGDLTNWKQLGGADEAIRVVYVDGGDGVTLSVAEGLFGTRSFTPADPIRVNFSSQVVKVVEQEPRALGVTQLGLTREHHLPELATDQTIEQELSLVTLGEPSPTQRAVIDAVRQVAAKTTPGQ
jgi:phosphate transport system substrate-binding protein